RSGSGVVADGVGVGVEVAVGVVATGAGVVAEAVGVGAAAVESVSPVSRRAARPPAATTHTTSAHTTAQADGMMPGRFGVLR
ncbi:MAG TPA: hypothetical protein VNZ66_00915, partial [Aeromicrobium sp.]|nr:hypothetical protein [Aeromicrobium sp.]